MKGPRTGSRQKHHSTAMRKTVTIYAIMTTDQSQKLVCLPDRQLLAPRPSISGPRPAVTAFFSPAPVPGPLFLADLPWRQDDLARSSIHEEHTSSIWGSSCSAFPCSLAINRSKMEFLSLPQSLSSLLASLSLSLEAWLSVSPKMRSMNHETKAPYLYTARGGG